MTNPIKDPRCKITGIKIKNGMLPKPAYNRKHTAIR